MDQIKTLLIQLGVNDTFYIMFGIFAVTYFIASSLLTRPVGSLLVERDRRTTGRREEVQKIRVELTEIVEKLTRERQRAQSDASQKFSELRNIAVTEQRKIMAEARDEFAAKVKAARDKIETSLVDERQKLERSTADLKDDIVAKLLGTAGSRAQPIGKEI